MACANSGDFFDKSKFPRILHLFSMNFGFNSTQYKRKNPVKYSISRGFISFDIKSAEKEDPSSKWIFCTVNRGFGRLRYLVPPNFPLLTKINFIQKKMGLKSIILPQNQLNT